jgi:hypothetical protein
MTTNGGEIAFVTRACNPSGFLVKAVASEPSRRSHGEKENSRMTLIAGDEVRTLRLSLLPQFRAATEELLTVSGNHGWEHNDWFTKPLTNFDAARNLLDRVGWFEREPELEVDIDVSAVRPTLVVALREQLDGECHLMDTHDPGQRAKARARASAIERLAGRLGLDIGEARDDA